MTKGDRETERQTDTETETDRQTNSQTGTQRQRQRDGHKHTKPTETDKVREKPETFTGTQRRHCHQRTETERKLKHSQKHIGDTVIRGQRRRLLAGCLTSQQQTSVSQGRIYSDNCTCCHAEIEVAAQNFHLTSHSILTPGQPVSALTI